MKTIYLVRYDPITGELGALVETNHATLDVSNCILIKDNKLWNSLDKEKKEYIVQDGKLKKKKDNKE